MKNNELKDSKVKTNNDLEHISIENLSKIFGDDKGIKDISFDIKRGSFHAIIGHNGAGKTTLIRSMLSLYKEVSGTIKINGINVRNPRAYDGISYISENPRFPNEFNAQEFLIWSARLSGVDVHDSKTLVFKYAERLGMSKLLRRNPNKFSSGEKQKIMLIKTLIENSEIILMDEPTANLDPSARIIFFDEIEKMNKIGKTIIICSHNLDEIENKVTWVSIINNGRLVYDKAKGNERLMDTFKKHAVEGINA